MLYMYIFFPVHVSHFLSALPPLVLFEDRTFDGSGQPSVQEAPETKNSFKKEEAQDQGPALRSKTRLSEVRGKHSSMSQSSSVIYPDTVFMAQLKHRVNKKKKTLSRRSVFLLETAPCGSATCPCSTFSHTCTQPPSRTERRVCYPNYKYISWPRVFPTGTSQL